MSDLKASSGEPLTTTKWNGVVDRLPSEKSGQSSPKPARLLLCRTTEAIAASTINSADTADSVYQSGVVSSHGLASNGDGTYSPAIIGGQRIMINASDKPIPADTELWAIDTFAGLLVSTIWICEV